jgi:RHS repeat-associated protein
MAMFVLLFAGTIAIAQPNNPTPEELLGSPSYLEPYQEFGKRMKAAREVGPLEGSMFGDSTSLYNGSTEFSVVDISVPGNSGLPVEVRRRLLIQERRGYRDRPGFANFEWDVPYLHGTFTELFGWKVGASASDQRCSTVTTPKVDRVGFITAEVWHGNFLYLPGSGDQEMLADAGSFPAITGGTPHPWITKGLVRFQCKPTLANAGAGASGEGFIGITPSGVRYTFDHLISVETTPLQKSWLVVSGPSGIGPQPPVQRRKIYLMATRAEDRFGNWVQYGYSGDKLTSISSNDGRSISMTYSGDKVATINVAGTPARTLSYAYGAPVPGWADGTLTSVTLPDQTQWTYAYSGSLIAVPSVLEPSVGTCIEPALDDQPNPFVLTITHPSKAQGAFSFRFKRHYRVFRSPLTPECNVEEPGGTYNVLLRPNYADHWALLSKQFTGPATDTAIWSYDYGSIDNAFPCDSCPDFRRVTVTEPDGAKLENDFGVVYNSNEGRLLRERVLAPGGAVLRDTTHSYASAPTGHADEYGTTLIDDNQDPMAQKIRPIASSSVAQQGLQFSTTVNSFDVYARPLSETKSSTGSPAFSKTEVVSYHDDLDIWVLGQEASRSVDGIAVHSTNFDASKAQPISVTSFGRADRTMTWHADGNLHQLKDALNRAFTLTNYERGVAKNIALPTGVAISATVDNYGNLLTVTDAVGFTTTYEYDARDRLSRIDYPSADTVAWAPTTIVTAPTKVSEYGIPAGLWQRTETTGALVKNTWFDARWRPILTREITTDDSTNATFQRRRFDHRNREVFSSYPSTGILAYTDLTTGIAQSFDALDRSTGTSIHSELGLLSSSIAYPSGALRQEITDARGFITRTDFQAYDQPSLAWPRRIVAALNQPEQQTTEITRDVFGKPTTIRRSGNYVPPTGTPQPQQLDRRFVYDQHQRLCKRFDPETGTTVFDYNTVNDIAWIAIGQNLPGATCDRQDAVQSQRSLHTYDALRRLTAIDHPAGTNDLAYSYYADGALHTASNTGTGSNTWTYSYNKRRLLESEALSYNARTFTIAHTYNSLGHRQSLGYPSGQTVAFQPDARGRPRQAGTYATAVTRHANGAISTFTYGNNIAHSTTLNLRQLPLRRSAGSVMDQWFAYDANANLIAIDDVAAPLPQNMEDRTLSYDGLNRLLTANAPQLFGNETYRYDALDNVRVATFGDSTFSYSYDGQQRLSAIALNGAPYHTYTHNDQGDTLSRVRIVDTSPDQLFTNGFEAVFPQRPSRALDAFRSVAYAPNQQYTYDRAHRLVDVQNIESYHYDAHGRRVATLRATDQVRHYQVYSQAGQLLHSEDLRIGVAIDYLHLDGDLIAERERHLATNAIAIRYHHPDTRGSATLITNASAQLQSRNFFAPYGSPYDSFYREGPGFAGHVTDSNTGLTYMQQRLYDPIAMRFLSPDPMDVDTGTGWNFNRYNYANNNPYGYIDPDGRIGFALIPAAAEACAASGACLKAAAATTIVVTGVAAYNIRGMMYSQAYRNVVFTDPAPDASTESQAKPEEPSSSGTKAEPPNPATKNRVKPRKGTIEQVTENQPVDSDGDMIDPNTGEKLKEVKVDLGHKPGQEWRRRKADHDKKGSTREQVIEAENDPNLYQWESRKSNRSHKHEKKD